MDSQTLREALATGGELALLDVREQGEFGQRHLFRAVNAPLSRLELEVPKLVPRRTTPVVLTAAGVGGLAARARAALSALGYADIAVCPDAPGDWEAAGFAVYSGINVPSKAFGEAVERHYATPSIPARTLKEMQDRGDDLVVLDSRTFAEYRSMNIPGGISVPGGEIAYRVRDLVASEATLVVVNCAGRTRSIIGAQSVIHAGIANPVAALENGAMGWRLAGLGLERGGADRFASGDPASLDAALAMRDAIAAAYGVRTIDREELDAWTAEAGTRTLYLLDVRDPDEFAAGHMPGSRSAPGGQLVQATDFQIGVPNGRIVLLDDTGVRATMAAHWLIQMGYRDVHVLAGGLDPDRDAEPGPGGAPEAPPAPEIDAGELSVLLETGRAEVLDLGESRAYRKAHIPAARWAIRTRIAAAGHRFRAGTLALTSQDGRLARFAAAEAAALTGAEIRVLAGGTDAWIAAGYGTEASPGDPPDEACLDVYLRAYDRTSDVEARMREYIDWEVALLEQIDADPDVAFRLGPVA